MDGILNELRYEPEREAREHAEADVETPSDADGLRVREDEGGEQGRSEEVATSDISEIEAEEAIIRFRVVEDLLKIAELEALIEDFDLEFWGAEKVEEDNSVDDIESG